MGDGGGRKDWAYEVFLDLFSQKPNLPGTSGMGCALAKALVPIGGSPEPWAKNCSHEQGGLCFSDQALIAAATTAVCVLSGRRAGYVAVRHYDATPLHPVPFPWYISTYVLLTLSRIRDGHTGPGPHLHDWWFNRTVDNRIAVDGLTHVFALH